MILRSEYFTPKAHNESQKLKVQIKCRCARGVPDQNFSVDSETRCLS